MRAINADVSASNRNIQASEARLLGDLRKVLLDLGERRNNGSGLLGSLVPQLVAGSVLVERVFAVPGTGQLLADSVFARDLPTVLGLALASGVAVVLATLLADALAALADPRLVDVEEG